MRELKIRDKTILVDDEDHELLVAMRWYLNNGRPLTTDGQTMARIIMGVSQDEIVFYRDGDTLNNQRHNLEVVSKSEAARRVGAIGGRLGTTGGFFADRELAREAGRKGGTISRRRAKQLMEVEV